MFLASTIFIHVNEMIQFLYLDVSMVMKYQYLFKFKVNNENCFKHIPDYNTFRILKLPKTVLIKQIIQYTKY